MLVPRLHVAASLTLAQVISTNMTVRRLNTNPQPLHIGGHLNLFEYKAMKNQVLHTATLYFRETAGEIWNWSLMGVKLRLDWLGLEARPVTIATYFVSCWNLFAETQGRESSFCHIIIRVTEICQPEVRTRYQDGYSFHGMNRIVLSWQNWKTGTGEPKALIETTKRTVSIRRIIY